ncbi:16S rRNA (cytidine(1402)-2'-O)-methyltransferase [Xylanibacillus composti]|uniref:Ribosomal RNA small subunit methyltransferase I n=1 Tax=Xylanibacillus composti TaxID=1572762 RepID=A0A8J4GY05_9BACL|nr:16S rRNA (cytidine(1402)-2'-O)-methyltransferase [Xylanibacillus composti]MDT9725165.1 16S rRNA (cytidine(1402)-2'-O)-methyltransferase [Xylanibacillus composti]GIQ67262.1 ribosomal RNA small subunit methyltransferase I [Xylanibacillus composti]
MTGIQRSFDATRQEGALYVVATPIGNLEDMTYRAVRMLKEADWIAAEDTRQTRKLLTHFEIEGKLVSYHEHNREASGKELVRRMAAGEVVALVSDAGLPAISDPGHDLVRKALDQHIKVIPIPGANAALTALVASGLPTGEFSFYGFFPREKKQAEQLLQRTQHYPGTAIFYESPYRVKQMLVRIYQSWGNRQAVLARELTKKFEEFARGSLEELLVWVEEKPPQGEYCVLVEGWKEGDSAAWSTASEPEWKSWSVAEHVARYEEQGLSRKDAMKKAAGERGVTKRDIYRELLEQLPE